MTDIQAAVGIEQLKKLPVMTEERRMIEALYHKKLEDIPWLAPPLEPLYGKTNWQSYPVKVLENAPLSRDELIQRLLDAGISTRRGIMNSHQEIIYSPMNWPLQKSEKCSNQAILLPMYHELEKNNIEYISDVLHEISHE